MGAGGLHGCGEDIPESSCDANKGEGTVSDHSGAQLNGGSLQESSSCSKDTLKGEPSDTHIHSDSVWCALLRNTTTLRMIH